MLLDRRSRIVLKTIRKHDFIDSSAELLPLLPARHKFALDSLDSTLWFLDRNRLLNCEEGEDSVYCMNLTYEGKHYGEFVWIDFKTFLFKSVMVPIVVAFITSCLTLLLSGAIS